MLPPQSPQASSCTYLVVVRAEPSGRFTAQLAGLPELQATAGTREEALEEARRLLKQWQDEGRLVPVELSAPATEPQVAPIHDSQDLLEKEFVEDLERFRREDLERTLREYDQGCSSSSSTPAT